MTTARWVTSKRWGPSERCTGRTYTGLPGPSRGRPAASAAADGAAPARPTGRRPRSRPPAGLAAATVTVSDPRVASAPTSGRWPPGTAGASSTSAAGRAGEPHPVDPDALADHGDQRLDRRAADRRHHQVDPAHTGPAQPVEHGCAAGRRPPAPAPPPGGPGDRQSVPAPASSARTGARRSRRESRVSSTDQQRDPCEPGPRRPRPAGPRRPAAAADAPAASARMADLARAAPTHPTGPPTRPTTAARTWAGAARRRPADRRRPATTPAVRPQAMIAPRPVRPAGWPAPRPPASRRDRRRAAVRPRPGRPGSRPAAGASEPAPGGGRPAGGPAPGSRPRRPPRAGSPRTPTNMGSTSTSAVDGQGQRADAGDRPSGHPGGDGDGRHHGGPQHRGLEPGHHAEEPDHGQRGHPPAAPAETPEHRRGHRQHEGDVLAGDDRQVAEPGPPEVVGHRHGLAPVVTQDEPGEQGPTIGRQRGRAPQQGAPQRVGDAGERISVADGLHRRRHRCARRGGAGRPSRRRRRGARRGRRPRRPDRRISRTATRRPDPGPTGRGGDRPPAPRRARRRPAAPDR